MGLRLSPYNFDYSMRLMIYYSYLGNFDRILEIHRALDIKGILTFYKNNNIYLI